MFFRNFGQSFRRAGSSRSGVAAAFAVGSLTIAASSLPLCAADSDSQSARALLAALSNFSDSVAIPDDATYLLRHNVHTAIESALSRALRSKPSNPLDIMASELRARAYDNPSVARAIRRIHAIKELFEGNLAAKHFDIEYFGSLSTAEQDRLLEIVRSGMENPDSQMGCYAMRPDDYDHFRPFFKKVLAGYHHVSEDAVHRNDWTLAGVDGLPADGKLDLTALGLPALSMRVRVGRNLQDFPLPGSMTEKERVDLEAKMVNAFDKLIADPRYGGRYYSLTPGHPSKISDEEYASLVKQHLMFKDMSNDDFLVNAGIARNWPFGRGCYVSGDRGFIVWVGEEDHLRIMCMKKGTLLNDVFDRLKTALDTVEGIPGLTFAKSKYSGYVTSCPTNMGTGMRASVHIKLPNLTADGTDAKAKAVAKPLGLSVRGLGGEHTPIGADGTVDISPSKRFCISEAEIITALYKGIKLLKEQEDTAGAK